MDIVYIRELEIETIIGIFDWEREVRQKVVLDLEMACDVRRAAATDSIADALDYKAIAKRLLSFVGESQFQLVETLAEQIATLLRDEFGVAWLRLRVNKRGALRHATDVGVIIERGERPATAGVISA